MSTVNFETATDKS